MWLGVRYSSELYVDWIDVACGQVQQWVVWIGLMWLVVRYSSGLCKHCKEASSLTSGGQIVQIFNNDIDRAGLLS
jgi:hypothetical protein